LSAVRCGRTRHDVGVGVTTYEVQCAVRDAQRGPAAYDDIASLTGITAPTLQVLGEIDALVSREMQDEIVRRIPAAKLVVYSGAGHTPRWDDPSRFSRDVAAFVTESLHTSD
jgi:pimeloyl-ACP methyl ester carboxylesterase